MRAIEYRVTRGEKAVWLILVIVSGRMEKVLFTDSERKLVSLYEDLGVFEIDCRECFLENLFSDDDFLRLTEEYELDPLKAKLSELLTK